MSSPTPAENTKEEDTVTPTPKQDKSDKSMNGFTFEKYIYNIKDYCLKLYT